ncbi:hypothetical protein TNCV_3134781 [Trichonephila clavipes]|nr:hypothetical protein TNCV_3134781 [Trichonephila clavipes]
MDHVFYQQKDPESEPVREAIQFGVTVVAHSTVELWLSPNTEGKEGQLSPAPRRCIAVCLKSIGYAYKRSRRVISILPIP